MYLTSWPKGVAATNGVVGRVKPPGPTVGGLLSPADRTVGKVTQLNAEPLPPPGGRHARIDHRNRVTAAPARSLTRVARPVALPKPQAVRQTMRFGRPLLATGSRTSPHRRK